MFSTRTNLFDINENMVLYFVLFAICVRACSSHVTFVSHFFKSFAIVLINQIWPKVIFWLLTFAMRARASFRRSELNYWLICTLVFLVSVGVISLNPIYICLAHVLFDNVVGGQYGRAVLHSHGGDIIISSSFGRAFKKKPKVKCLREPT